MHHLHLQMGDTTGEWVHRLHIEVEEVDTVAAVVVVAEATVVEDTVEDIEVVVDMGDEEAMEEDTGEVMVGEDEGEEVIIIIEDGKEVMMTHLRRMKHLKKRRTLCLVEKIQVSILMRTKIFR